MALSKTWKDRSSLEPVADAYIRFSTLFVDDDNHKIELNLRVYRSKAARMARLEPIDTIQLVVNDPEYEQFAGEDTTNAASIGGLAYVFAKSQEVLAGAADV